MATQQSRTLARLMMAPSVIVLLVWMIVPLALTLWFSFQNYNLLNPVQSFAGSTAVISCGQTAVLGSACN